MKVFSGILCVLILLYGCGQPGPLYLPKDQPDIYAAPPPATTQTKQENKDTSQERLTPEQSPSVQLPQ
jgi:predicted small lipoprotein YifL